SDARSGASWALAKRTTQAAITAASVGDQVWVAKGIYPERITLKASVKVYGGFAGTETALEWRNWGTNVTTPDGGAAGSVITVPSTIGLTTVFDGFTVQNGSAGGIHCSGSPAIANCVITQNQGESGGGIYNESGSPLIQNCSVNANVGHFGG